MNEATAERLLRLNREFYDRFAREFAETRSRISPGMKRALALAVGARSLVDLGCGDGRVGRALRDQTVANSVQRYRGVDFSLELLRRTGFAAVTPGTATTTGPVDTPDPAAKPSSSATPGPTATPGTATTHPSHPDFRFVEADLASPGWSLHPDLSAGQWDFAVCFSVLFHLPGAERRTAFLREMRELLHPSGRAVVSVWQLLHQPRMRAHVVPWEEAQFTQAEVDPGDLLVDWRRGGRGWRYVHHFDEEELFRLCRDAGLNVRERYRSDGQSGDMSLFVVLGR